MTWPFPTKPIPVDHKPRKFNPDNFEDALL